MPHPTPSFGVGWEQPTQALALVPAKSGTTNLVFHTMNSPLTTRELATQNQSAFRVDLETPAGPRTIDCRSDQYIWDAAASQGIELPAICHQGRCLTCAGKLLSGTADNPDANQYFPEDEAAGFVLLCRARPLTNCCVQTHQEWEMRAHRLAHGLPAPYA